MNTRTSILLFAAALSLTAGAANAEWRCDCTTIVDNCTATVTVREKWIDVTSDTQACARVDYFVDGMPLVAMLVGGQDRQDWLARSSDPNILIQSCQVCADHAGDAPPPPTATTDTELTPVIEVAPVYPEAAAASGVEGHVEVGFTVTPFGQVTDPTIESAEPAGTFDQAALSAISRWRFTVDESREPVKLTHRFDFDLGDALMALSPTAAAPATARPSSTERNQCVRERVSYNYGEMVEVGLINACEEPIVVYSCAEGTGRQRQQWVCISSTGRGQVLIRPGDSRAGAPVAGSGPTEFAEELYVARAPNTQYWWLACDVDDADCRTAGEQWLRAMDRQLASVDPRNRATRPLARAN